uniref:Retrotransposon gag domain-containing protein n=1 Tax=Fagus sylvatica TaxID=28930 RepID=A0A2N9FD55_FAGSY
MVALERKFDELLNFVQLIAKRNPNDENQRKENDKDTNEGEPEGHSNTNVTPPPPTPPKPEGKDSQLDSKIDSLEEKIRLMQGLNSFGNTDFSSMSWFPNMTMPPKFKAPEFEKYNGRGDPMIHLQMYCRKMAPYADNEPLLIQTFQDTLTGHAAEWIGSIFRGWRRRATKPSGNMPRRWREKAARARPPLDEKRDDQDLRERIKDALKTKKIVDMIALMALAEQAAKKAPMKKKEGDVQMIGRSNGRPRQVLPTFTMQPIQPRPTPTPAPTQVPAPAPAPQIPARPVGNQYNDNRFPRKEFRQFTPLTHTPDGVVPHPDREEPNLACRPETLQRPTKKGFQPKFDLRFPLWRSGTHSGKLQPTEASGSRPNRPRSLEKHHQGPSTGDACEYHSGARGHSLECCEEFKKEVANLAEKGLVKKEEILSGGDCQSYDPSDLDWYAELNLDDIVKDEMDLDNLQDEGDDWGYFMEDDTDEWRNVDFTKLFQFPCLIVPPGFETLEFEIFYENGDPEAHLQKYRREDGLTLGERAFDDLGISREPVKTSSRLVLSAEEPYWLGGFGKSLFGTIKEESSMSSLPALTEGEEEEKAKPLPPAKDPDSTAIAEEREEPIKTPPPSNITTTTAEEEYAGPMVEGLSIHTIAEEEDSTAPQTSHCQQGEEAKMWTCVPLLQRVSRLHAKPQTIPTSPKLTTKTNCSLDNIDNSDEEIELPNDILEALERQDEGSKPNIEELEIINLADEGEEPREVKIGTRCTTEQKEALIALLREFPRDLRLVLPRHARPRHRHSGPQDSVEARMQARQTSTATNEA